MLNVYEKDGGYTPEANHINNQVRQLLKPLIQRELDCGTPIEALEHVIYHAVNTEILKQSVEIRIKESTKQKHIEHDEDDDFLYYMVDVDIYEEGCGVSETVKTDLFRSKSLAEAIFFARKYAEEKKNFDFKYLEGRSDYYAMTIRKYYKEETDTENADYDDWDTIRVFKPKKNKK